MIMQLNLQAPPATPIQRLNLIKLVPPIVPAEQYCGIVSGREGEVFACALVHPYKTAHLFAPAFPAMLLMMQTEYWPSRQLADIIWADIAYACPECSRPQLLVRTTRIESPTAEIVWQERDLTYARSWESRVRPLIDLLERTRA